MPDLAIKVAVMQEQMDNIEEKVEHISDTLDEFIETAEKRFASKWVEKVAVATFIALLAAIIALILKQ